MSPPLPPSTSPPPLLPRPLLIPPRPYASLPLPPQVERLLCYLDVVVDTYTHRLGDDVAHVVLPPPLVFPSLSQVRQQQPSH